MASLGEENDAVLQEENKDSNRVENVNEPWNLWKVMNENSQEEDHAKEHDKENKNKDEQECLSSNEVILKESEVTDEMIIKESGQMEEIPAYNTVPGADRTLKYYTRKLGKLHKQKTKHEHHLVFLNYYLENDIIPRGLEIKLNPAVKDLERNNFHERWQDICGQASKKLTELLLEYHTSMIRGINSELTSLFAQTVQTAKDLTAQWAKDSGVDKKKEDEIKNQLIAEIEEATTKKILSAEELKGVLEERRARKQLGLKEVNEKATKNPAPVRKYTSGVDDGGKRIYRIHRDEQRRTLYNKESNYAQRFRSFGGRHSQDNVLPERNVDSEF